MKYAAFLMFGIFLALNFISCEIQPAMKYEIRAVWMSRFEFAQGKSPEESQTYIRNSFKKFSDAGINLILFQVRGNADAFYHSAYEPWSDLLGEKIGDDPGWDPLQFAINAANEYGMELHAWINTFPAWRAGQPLPPESNPMHPILLHPGWLVCDSLGNTMQPALGYLTFSPGIPAVQEHVRNVVLNIILNYDVDGIHFDYIRYPEGTLDHGYSADSVSTSRFKSEKHNPLNLSWHAWQREQISNFVSAVYDSVIMAKPWIKVSAAVLGHHHGGAWNGFYSVDQDARRWLATQKMDLLFPMTYTRMEHPVAPYGEAIDLWSSMVYLKRLIVPGVATYKVGRQFTWREVYDQIKLIRQREFPGMVFFSANTLLDGINKISEKYYPKPTLIPPLTWKENVPPAAPSKLHYKSKQDSLIFKWHKSPDARHFVLYNDINIDDPAHIIAILPGEKTGFSIKNTGAGNYYLTAVNRVGIESRPVVFKNEH